MYLLLQKIIIIQTVTVYLFDTVTGQPGYVIFKILVGFAVTLICCDISESLVKMVLGMALSVETFVAKT